MPRLARWPRTSHPRAAGELQARPGVWHRIGVYRSTVTASNTARRIRTATELVGRAYQPAGSFDAHTTHYGDYTAVIAR